MTASRRTFMAGSAATASLASAAKGAELAGAFPSLPDGRPLLGPADGIARLMANENPYGPAPSAIRAMDHAVRKGAFYATEAEAMLAAMIAARHGLSPDNVVISTGSAEFLSAAAMLYGQNGPIVAPRLFFDATALYAQRLGLATIERAPMSADLAIDLAAMEAMVGETTGLVQICNPNNPTGRMLDPAALKPAVVRMAAKAPVLIDEAYMELVDDPAANSCVDLVRGGHDVMIGRTFSKIYGMAGIRVGYLLGPAGRIAALRTAKMSWMSGVGLAGAIASYDDAEFLARSKAMVREGRETIQATFDRMGIEVLPTQTNFLYFRSGVPADALAAVLADSGILIRGKYMDYDGWSRVSTGRNEDVARFCEALPGAIQKAA